MIRRDDMTPEEAADQYERWFGRHRGGQRIAVRVHGEYDAWSGGTRIGPLPTADEQAGGRR